MAPTPIAPADSPAAANGLAESAPSGRVLLAARSSASNSMEVAAATCERIIKQAAERIAFFDASQRAAPSGSPRPISPRHVGWLPFWRVLDETKNGEHGNVSAACWRVLDEAEQHQAGNVSAASARQTPLMTRVSIVAKRVQCAELIWTLHA